MLGIDSEVPAIVCRHCDSVRTRSASTERHHPIEMTLHVLALIHGPLKVTEEPLVSHTVYYLIYQLMDR
jgi:hypothetical protein